MHGIVARALVIALSARVLSAPAAALAQGAAPATPAKDSAAAPPPADSVPATFVVFHSDTLFRLYGNLGPFSAAQRAAAVTTRLADLARSASAKPDTVAVVERADYSELVTHGITIMSVLDSDAVPLLKPRSEVASEYAMQIQRSLGAAREQLTARALLIDAAYAAAATLVLLLALAILHFAFPRIYKRLEAIRRSRIPALRIQQLELLSADGLARALLLVARIARAAVTLLLLYVYVPLVLSFFPWTEPLSRRIVGYALTPLAATWHAFIGFVPSLFYLIVIVVVTRYLLELVHAIFRAIESGAVTFAGFYPEWAEPTYKIARVLVLALAAVLCFPYLPGAHTDAFKGVSLFLGVLFSLGSSSAVSNIVAGIVLTYTRAFEVGDRVQVGESIGDVTERSLLVTRLRTIKNVEVTIPNGAVLASSVLNFTRLAAGPGLLLHTTVTIGYDAPWRVVHDLLTSAAGRTEHILAAPKPFVLQTALDDFYVSYEINAATSRADLMAATYSALHANIQDAFNEAGVEIMSPHYGALRDGNAIAIPPDYVPADAEAPAFRIQLGRRPGASVAGESRRPT